MRSLRWLVGGVSVAVLLTGLVADGQQRPERGAMPPRGRRGPAMDRAAFTAPVYSHLYDVPKEILEGRAAEWLAAHEKGVAGIPPTMRHKERLREVFSAALAVRVGGLDAAVWGKRLYAEKTVARQVFDALGSILAGDPKALPILIDAVPAEEKIGGGWQFMGQGLYQARETLGDKVAPAAGHLLILAGVAFPAALPKDEQAVSRQRENLNVFRSPDETMQPIADVIASTKGGPAWQLYQKELDSRLLHLSQFGALKTQALTRLAFDLCDDPETRNQMARALKHLLPGEAEKTARALDEHKLKTTGDPRAAMSMADRKAKEGAYDEALALYRQAEESLQPENRSRACHSQFALLVEAEKKGGKASTTFAEELARRKQAAGAGEAGATIAYADALLCAGRNAEGVQLAKAVATKEGETDNMRLRAWKLVADSSPEAGWELAAGMPRVFAEGNQIYSTDAYLCGVAASRFAEAAEWLGAFRAIRPNVACQAREALLWCAAGKPDRAKAVLAIDEARPKDAIMVLTQYLQADESWSSSGSGGLNGAAVAAMKQACPPGTGWPLGVDYALRILASPRLRREEEATRVWQEAVIRMPKVESKETTALAQKVTAVAVDWAKESLPAAAGLFDRTAMTFNGWQGQNPARVDCAQTMVEETLAVLSAKGVPENKLQSTFFQLRGVFNNRHMSDARKKALAEALLKAYPSLADSWPELRKL